jgi:ABC-2 type transport system ATP-binding protein
MDARNNAAAKNQPAPPAIELIDVSRWYGEILGINRVTVALPAGITGLVGPNGSGKSTMMNLIAGLLRPGQGQVRVMGQEPWNNPALRRRLGYCSQVDHFYEGFTGQEFIEGILSLHGQGRAWARAMAEQSLARAGMAPHRHRRLRAYSKGMRQRAKIALSLAHNPDVLILDEPFNGLDPVGRREMMELFIEYAREGRTLLISSHILHEIEMMTDNILMMSNGYIMAEGEIRAVREQLHDHPFQVFIRCDAPRRLAALMLECDGAVEQAQIEGSDGVTLSTRDPDLFYTEFAAMTLRHNIRVDVVTLADENMQSIYRYLSGREHH